MSERLPYEDSLRERLNDLPLPDEDRSWQKMELLLDKDDDDDRIPPPILLRGCLGWGLLLVGLLAALWFVFRPEKWFRGTETEAHRSASAPAPGATPSSSGSQPPAGQTTPAAKQPSAETPPPAGTPDPAALAPGTNPSAPQKPSRTDVGGRSSAQTSSTALSTRASGIRSEARTPCTAKSNRDGSLKRSTSTRGLVQGATPQKKIPAALRGSATRGRTGSPAENGKDPVASTPSSPRDTGVLRTEPPPTPVSSKAPDTAAAKPKIPAPPVAETKPSDSSQLKKKNRKDYYLSAGLGLQQGIPFAGQKGTSYNYYGRKSSWAEYIPVPYLRLHRAETWYLQAEFRFGAPQAVKQVAYQQQVTQVTDTFGTPLSRTTNTVRVQRTFYHQFPLTFNYTLFPHFSLGTGIQYSRFYGAVAEREIRKQNFTAQRDSSFKHIEQVKPGDSSASVFSQSQLHWVAQFEYQWKRLTVGGRFSQGLQPFIRYTDPGGTEHALKNQSLNVFLRFRLWKSKNF